MITRENYFEQENEMKFFGSTQFKAFMECEEGALAKITGKYEPEVTPALLTGSYVDAHFEGTLDIFQAQHPELFTRSGDLKVQYKQAEEIIQRIERDSLFMRYMSGEKQVIKTGTLFSHDFKIRMDSYHPGKAIVDLKIIRDFEPIYKEGLGRVHFIDAWGYDIQAAIYQAVEGNKLPFIIAAATKEKGGADIDLIRIPQYKIDAALKIVEAYIDRFADIKAGKIEPRRCGKCVWCRSTKVLTGIKEYKEIESNE